jgi:hypothetical protein
MPASSVFIPPRPAERGDAVVGIDVVNDYYDPAIKEARLKILEETAARTGALSFFRANLADRGAVEAAFAEGGVRRVVNLAAQAGVRYSIENPHAYVESNIVGSPIFSKPAVMAGSSIWSMPRPVRSMAPTLPCRSASTSALITRCNSMPPPRRPTN